MQLFLTRRFLKRYESLPKEVQKNVRGALETLPHNPFTGKRLSGVLEGEYSLRVGRYRILYTIQGKKIFAETVRHRKEAYR